MLITTFKIIGILAVAAGILVLIVAMLGRVFRRFPEAGSFLFCLFFLAGGTAAAWGTWPDVIAQIRAANWPSVPYEMPLEHRGSSRRASSDEVEIHYVFNGVKHETIVRDVMMGNSKTPTVGNECRVNPEKPSQAVLLWGWRPGHAVVFFPLPFLTIGLFGLAVSLIPPLRKLVESSAVETDAAIPPKPSSIILLATLGLGLIFPFFGVLAGVWGEVWIAGEPSKWVLSVFMLPFAWIFATICYRLINGMRNLRRA